MRESVSESRKCDPRVHMPDHFTAPPHRVPNRCDSGCCKQRQTRTLQEMRHTDIRPGTEISWSKGIKIIQSLFSYYCGIMLETNIKRFKITHIFSNAVWHLPRELCDLAIENLNKVRRLKNHGGWLQRRKHLNEKIMSKWEINIKDTLKTPMYLQIKFPFLNKGYI